MYIFQEKKTPKNWLLPGENSLFSIWKFFILKNLSFIQAAIFWGLCAWLCVSCRFVVCWDAFRLTAVWASVSVCLFAIASPLVSQHHVACKCFIQSCLRQQCTTSADANIFLAICEFDPTRAFKRTDAPHQSNNIRSAAALHKQQKLPSNICMLSCLMKL